jgi:hypothetical protein
MDACNFISLMEEAGFGALGKQPLTQIRPGRRGHRSSSGESISLKPPGQCAGRLELDQSLVNWLPELADRQVLRRPAAEPGEPCRLAGPLRFATSWPIPAGTAW